MNKRLAMIGSILVGWLILSKSVCAESEAMNLSQDVVELAPIDSTSQDDSDLLNFDISNISFDDLNILDKEHPFDESKIDISDLTLKEKLKLLVAYLKIKTAECGDSTKQHILRNQRKYIWGAASGVIVLSVALAYWYKHHRTNTDLGK